MSSDAPTLSEEPRTPVAPSEDFVPAEKTPFRDILAYSSGEGTNSLIMNSIAGFGMLYYTEALDLQPTLAGAAVFVATIWDAITDPIMGHVSDNTRSRFGRRHPYMLIGGLLSVFFFTLIWYVPDFFKQPQMLFGWEVERTVVLFTYLCVVNLCLRTFMTVFIVPYGALGFEVATDYEQRSLLQSVRIGLNMGVNLLACAILGWSLFLRDRNGVDGTQIEQNYMTMGAVFSLIALFFVLIVLLSTRKYMLDTRDMPPVADRGVLGFFKNMGSILLDRMPRRVFIFMGIVLIGISFVSYLQLYVYTHFLALAPWEKSWVHGGSMVGCGLGAFLASPLVKWLDKKPAVYIAVLMGSLANVLILVLFVPGFIEPGAQIILPRFMQIGGMTSFPIATFVFFVLHATYWAGNGTMFAIAGSMIADISEINCYRTGVLKDGGYGAVMSFLTKAAISFGPLLAGMNMDLLGFDAESNLQTPQVVRNLVISAFTGATVIALLAMTTIAGYPVTRDYMMHVKHEIAKRRAQQAQPSAEPATDAPSAQDPNTEPPIGPRPSDNGD